MYDLFKRVPNGLQTLVDSVSVYIKDQASRENASNDLKERLDHFLKVSFNNDDLFKERINTDLEMVTTKHVL